MVTALSSSAIKSSMSSRPTAPVISVLRSSPYLSRSSVRSFLMTSRMFCSLLKSCSALNFAAQVVVLLQNLVAFEGGELAQLHPHNGFGLRFGHAIAGQHADLALERL